MGGGRGGGRRAGGGGARGPGGLQVQEAEPGAAGSAGGAGGQEGMRVTHSFPTTCLTFLPTRPRCGATRTHGSTIFVKGGARAGQGRCGHGAPWRPPKQDARPSPSRLWHPEGVPPVSASLWGSPGLGHPDGVPPTSVSSWGLPGSQRPREVPSHPSYGIHPGSPSSWAWGTKAPARASSPRGSRSTGREGHLESVLTATQTPARARRPRPSTPPGRRRGWKDGFQFCPQRAG